MNDDRFGDDALPRHADELPSIQFLRGWARGSADPEAFALDDDEILRRWRAQDRRFAPHLEYGTHTSARGHADPLHDAVPLQSLAQPHRIGFVVLDGVGEPFPELAFVLLHRGRELERGVLGNDATVRRADVTDDEYTLQLVGIDAVSWGARHAGLGEPITLHVRATGLDHRSLEVRVFEEFRERDDDELTTTTITVNSRIGVALWTPVRSHLPEDPARGTTATLVAGVRDGDGHWAKTDIPLMLELPTIVTVGWSAPSSTSDVAVELGATTQGFADGTTLEFDVWRVDWSGDDVHVLTLDTATIIGGRATASWIPELPAEYWFSASVSTNELATASSGLLVAT